MLRMRLRANESIDIALKRFKRLLEKSGIRTDMRRGAFYEKPSVRRRRSKRRRLKKIIMATTGSA